MKHVGRTQKVLICLFTGIIFAAVLRRILARYCTPLIPMPAVLVISLLSVPLMIGYAIAWQRQDKQGRSSALVSLAFLQSVIAYTLAFDLASFGWQKIGHLQMVVPLGVLDLPFNSLDGETLTWAYFRRSYGFTVTIALCQMGSAYLLMWPRTRLLGLISMIPILANIILIDFFYQLPIGVLIHALLLMTGVIYLLMQYRSELVDIFLRRQPAGTISSRTTHFARLAVIVIPLLLVVTYTSPDKHPQFTGKYRISHLRVNGHPLAAYSSKDSIPTTLYMDWQDDFVLEFNDFRSRYFGTYKYNAQNDSMYVGWRYPEAATLHGTFKKGTGEGNYLFSGKMGEEDWMMELDRLPEP